jgi:hypothetical protein
MCVWGFNRYFSIEEKGLIGVFHIEVVGLIGVFHIEEVGLNKRC